MSRRDANLEAFPTAGLVLMSALGLMVFFFLVSRQTHAQAELLGFLVGVLAWCKGMHRFTPEMFRVHRHHTPRVFEEDPLTIDIALEQTSGGGLQMLELEDQFQAAEHSRERHLIPALYPSWNVSLKYRRQVDRHRGTYWLGPLHLRLSDPFGVFVKQFKLPPMTRLIVYPKADLLPDYTIPSKVAPHGGSLDTLRQPGQTGEMLGLREYTPGDPPQRVHWRTSARRGELYTVQLERSIQTRLAVFLDLTQETRRGLGQESSTEIAIHAATAVLTHAFDRRHRLSLTLLQDRINALPSGQGLAHLHACLDLLAQAQPLGQLDFWEHCGPPLLALPPGSRAVLIVTSGRVDTERTTALIQHGHNRQIAIDLIIIDERSMLRIHDHGPNEPTRAEATEHLQNVLDTCQKTGAQLYLLDRERPRLSTESIPDLGNIA